MDHLDDRNSATVNTQEERKSEFIWEKIEWLNRTQAES